MSVDPTHIEQYNGKFVELYLLDVKYEGTIEMASSVGIAFRPKGKRDVMLVQPKDVARIDIVPEKPKPLVARTLKPLEESSARRHLFHLHNFERGDLADVTDEEALDLHEDIDHTNLGHKHKDPDLDESDEDEESEDDDNE